VLAEPLPVAGRRLVAGDVHVGHRFRPQGRGGVLHHGREISHGPVEYVLPVTEHDLLVGPAGGPDQLPRLGWQQLGVEAVGEHLPHGRKLGPAELARERLDQAGELLDLQWLVDADDTAGRIPGGVHRRRDAARRVADEHGRCEPGAFDHLVQLSRRVSQVIGRLGGRLPVPWQVDRQHSPSRVDAVQLGHDGPPDGPVERQAVQQDQRRAIIAAAVVIEGETACLGAKRRAVLGGVHMRSSSDRHVTLKA